MMISVHLRLFIFVWLLFNCPGPTSSSVPSFFRMLRFYCQERHFKRATALAFPKNDGDVKNLSKEWQSSLIQLLGMSHGNDFAYLRVVSAQYMVLDPSGANITGSYINELLEAKLTKKQFQHFLILPLFNNDHLAIVQTMMKMKYLSEYPMLVITKETQLPWLNYIPLPMNNRLEIASEASDSTFHFWEAYRPAKYLPHRLVRTGIWSPGTQPVQQNFLKDGEPWSRRTDLTGMKIRCTTMPGSPHTFVEESKNGKTEVSGAFGDLFQILGQSLNFTSECKMPDDNGYGVEKDDGTWSGMIGDLVEDRADIAVAPLDITEARSRVVDYVFPLHSTSYALIIKTPTAKDNAYSSYYRIFSPNIWLLTFAALISFSLVIKGASRCLPNERKIELSEALLYGVGNLCNVGMHFPSESNSGRITCLTLFLTTIVLLAYFSGYLISSLTVSKAILPFENIQGLYEARSEYELGFNGIGSLIEFIKESKSNVWKNVWSEMLTEENKKVGSADGLNRVLSENFIYIIGEVFFMNRYFNCSYTVIPTKYFDVRVSWPMQKDSPLYPVFNYQLMRFIESGFYDVLWPRYTVDASLLGCDVNELQVLDVTNLSSAYIVLCVFGGIGSILLLVIEIAFKRRKK